MTKKSINDKQVPNNQSFFTAKPEDDMVCKAFRTGYFEPLDEMPEENAMPAIENVHASL